MQTEYDCRVRVYHPFVPYFILFMFFLVWFGTMGFGMKVMLAMHVLGDLPVVLLSVVGGVVIASFATYWFMRTLMPVQGVSLQHGTLMFERHQDVHLASIRFYDTPVLAREQVIRQYLAIRLRHGYRIRLMPTGKIGNAAMFKAICLEFVQAINQVEHYGRSPEMRSFYGSVFSQMAGFSGLVLLLVVNLMALIMAPKLLFMSLFLSISGWGVFLKLFKSLRPRA